MPREPLSLDFPPGVVKRQSPLGAKGRYTDCLNARFWNGRAQKWGGWTALPLDKLIAGIVRGCWSWGDQTARQLIGAGSSEKLYAISDSDFILNDITPLVRTVTVSNVLYTTAGLPIVGVALTAHGLVVGQYVTISGAATVGGVNFNGNWKVVSIADVNSFNFVAAQTATSSAGPAGGASITFAIEIAPGLVDPAQGFGWGAGGWGNETWGTARSVSGISFYPRIWSIKNFGKVMLASHGDGPIYSWDPTQAPLVRAAALGVGPTLCTGVVVTSDGIVIAYGTNQSGARDLMEVWYSAQGNYLDWDITAVAGSNGSPSRVNRLREGTKIVYAEDLGSHVTLMWTNTALYAMQYTGSQYVFNTNLAGRQCGLIGPMASVIVGATAYWMGPDNFHVYNGSVQAIPHAEDISEWVFGQIQYPTKTIAWHNKRYNEIYWLFCSGTETEPSVYVCYSISGQFWNVGKIIRTGATALRTSDARPILFGKDGKVYRHDDGLTANGETMPWYMVAEGIDMMHGEQLMEVDGYVADMERQVGAIDVTFTFYDHTPAGRVLEEEETITVDAIRGLTDARGAGRELALTFSGGAASPTDDFRFGIPKLNTFPGSSRE